MAVILKFVTYFKNAGIQYANIMNKSLIYLKLPSAQIN